MLKKILFLFVGFILVQSVFSSDCSLFSQRDSCNFVTSSSLNQFGLENTQGLLDFEAEIYYKNSPSYKIPLTISNNQIIQESPFTVPGVYILELTGYDIAKNDFDFSFEILFDNTVPLPPIVPVALFSNNGNLLIDGKTNFGSLNVIIENINGDRIGEIISNSQGDFSINLNNLDSFQILNFYTVGENGVKSSKLQRIVLSQRSSYVDLSSNIQISDLASVNSNTINQGDVLVTTQREFLVTGSSNGDFLYVNGIKTPVVDGKFGSFVHLNEGLTEIYINGEGVEQIIKVNYFQYEFIFEKVNIPSLISSNSVEIEIESNLNLEILVYLNGKYFSTQRGDFTLTLTDLRAGRNIVSLIGPNGKIIERHVFVDMEEPQINIKSEKELFEGSNFVFTIKDDIGLDLSSLQVRIGTETFSGDVIEMMGDYFIVDIGELNPGEYNNGLITITDLSGKSQSQAFELSISKDLTSFIHFFVNENGYFLGDKFFFNKEEALVTLTPSRNVAFKNIYLDGVDVIDYIIKSNYEVEINLKNLKNNGSIEVIYMNSDREEFSNKFEYVKNSEKPKFVLHSVNSLFSNSDLVIYGEIISNHFNWDTLEINGLSSYIRRGNFVEIYLENLNSRNLDVRGYDYGLNNLDTILGSLFQYSDDVNVGLDELNKYVVKGNFNMRNQNLINVNSFDSFNYISNVFGNSINLPVSSRYGIRSSKLSFGVGDKKNQDFSLVTIDGVEPIVYLVQNLAERYLIIDGTGSEVDENSISINIDSQKIDSFSYCNDKVLSFGKNFRCVVLPQAQQSSLIVSVSDKAGNNFSKEFNYFEDSITLESFNNLLLNPRIYISGSDILVNSNNNIVQGTYIGANLKHIKIGNFNCAFDSTNFVCPVELDIGLNNLNIEAIFKDDNGQDILIQDEINVTLVGNKNIIIDSIRGSGIFQVNSQYFYIGGDLIVDLLENDFERLEVLVGGFIIDSNSNSNSITLNLDEVVSGFNEKELEISVRGENEDGSSATSNKIVIIYKRLIETFVSVFVG